MLRKLTALGLTLPLAMATLDHAVADRSMSFLDQPEFIGALKDLIARAKSPELAAFRVFELNGTDMPWKDIDLKLAKGQSVTFLLGGRVWVSREADLWAEPGNAFHVRSRGVRPIYNPMSNTGTMVAAHDGPIEIARALAEWQSEDGTLWTPEKDYKQVDVKMYGVALAWRGNALKGVKSLLAHGDVGGVLGAELARIDSPRRLPKGWNNLYMLGGGPVIFNDIGNGHISCQSQKNAGILQRPVSEARHEAQLALDRRGAALALPRGPGHHARLPVHRRGIRRWTGPHLHVEQRPARRQSVPLSPSALDAD
jgi:hypothetical protein